MKIGLVARADSTGLGVQTMEFFHHMSVKKVLILDLCNFGDKNLVLFPERFLNENGTLSGRVFQGIPDSEVLDWFLEDLDVVYTAETPYNYELFRKAEERGVKTILHMNPEFNYYHFNQVAPRPSAIALPTHWKKDEVSLSTHVLPVPVAAERFTDRGSEEREGKIVHFLHVVGHPAIHDRNGTRDLIAALSHVTQPMTITFTCQKKDYVWDLMKEVAGLSGILDFPNDVVVINDPVTYENYWDIYSSAEFDALVMPRRYGGLCLEEHSKVVMSDGRRRLIRDVNVGEQIFDEVGLTTVYAKACRDVEEGISIHVAGLEILSSTDHRHLVVPTSKGQKKPRITRDRLQQVKAEEVRVGDWMMVKQPEPHGITSVDMGKKPRRRSLSFWPEHVELDAGWARLIGLWLAEGHRGLYARKDRAHGLATVMWSFGPSERYLAEEVVALLKDRGIHAKIKESITGTSVLSDGRIISGTGKTMYSVQCRTLWLYEFFEHLGLGHGAHGKHAPDVDASLVPDLIGGWLDGDGCRSQGANFIEGFSRSTDMIRELWRLAAKKGVFGRIYTNGQRLHFGGDDEEIVASWTHRMNQLRTSGVRRPHVRNYRRCDGGWMVMVNRVQKTGPMSVVAIETVSGRYIANDILTHNCLPAQEALASGLPVIMPNISPNNDLLPSEWLTPAETYGQFMAAMPVDLYRTDPKILAGYLDRFADREWLDAQRSKAILYAAPISWAQQKPQYESFFQAVVAGYVP